MLSVLKKTVVLGAAMVVAFGSNVAQARDETIKMVVPYSAGGVGDSLARRLADVMRSQSGKVVIVENIGGAGGTIGAANVARSKPDGQTMMLASTSALTIGPNLNPVNYDPKRDFTAVRSAAISPVAIVATKIAPFNDLKGALEYARKNPDAVRFGTPGQGSAGHLAMEDFQARTGVKLTHIPYRGDGPAMQDALGGVFELLVLNTPSLLPQVRAGNFKPLAVMEPKRLEIWPDVPTLGELGIDGMDYRSDFGVFAPANMDDKTRQAVQKMVDNAVDSAEFGQLLESYFLLPGTQSGESYAKQLAAEGDRNAELIKVRKIAP